MILLLTGSSETARGLLMEKLLGGVQDWRHLSLEDLQEEKPDRTLLSFEEEFKILLACECAKEVHNEGLNIAVTCHEPHLLMMIQQAFPGDLTSVYLGAPEEQISTMFDHVINASNQSVNDAYKALRGVIKKRVRE